MRRETIWQGSDPPDRMGPYKIRIARSVLEDGARGGRCVPYKLYYPEEAADAPVQRAGHPVIIWSHGLGGGRDGSAFLARSLASHGYIHLNIQHPGTDTGLWEGQPGHPWDVIRNTHIMRKATLQRFQDVPFVLDRLGTIAREHEAAAYLMDSERIGMSGHSFGAMTTQVIAGQLRGNDNRQYSLYDPRISCGVLYSPVPAYSAAESVRPALYQGIRIPLFHMTGTDDLSPVQGFGFEMRREVYDYAEGAEQHLLVLKDGDHMVFTGSRGQLGHNPKREIHEDIICRTALAFWDGYLGGMETARDWMKNRMQDWLAGEARHEYKHGRG